eukprot:m.128939 g.128939  ORF g.128939 m.128939 type:complete len:70 (-) comp13649_c0_seq3:61-270(-)
MSCRYTGLAQSNSSATTSGGRCPIFLEEFTLPVLFGCFQFTEVAALDRGLPAQQCSLPVNSSFKHLSLG